MVSDIKSFANDLKRAKRDIEQARTTRTRQAGRRYAWQAKRRIINHDAVASTELFRGVGYQAVAAGPDASQVRLESDASHSGYVEHGTGRKGDGTYPENPNVPVVVIKQWGDIKPSFTWRQDPWGAAASIAQNISEEGTDPQPFFYDSVDNSFDRMVRGLRKDLKEAL